jgi:hypothetical protein
MLWFFWLKSQDLITTQDSIFNQKHGMMIPLDIVFRGLKPPTTVSITPIQAKFELCSCTASSTYRKNKTKTAFPTLPCPTSPAATLLQYRCSLGEDPHVCGLDNVKPSLNIIISGYLQLISRIPVCFLFMSILMLFIPHTDTYLA